MVSTSARLNNSSLLTYLAPARWAPSRVRLGLHAMTSMPKAAPTRATRVPIRPTPSTLNTAPPSWRPTDVCQPPARTDEVSSTIRRAAARMSAQVSSTVDSTEPPVVLTWMPRSSAAMVSIEALNGPVDAIIRRFGSRSSTLRDNGVRSRMTHTTSNGSSLATTASGSAR
jgi:hypothetical protein